jgi:Etoposide-induced protein 2.4 (EI24)
MRAYGRAVLSQLHGRMLLLSLIPFVLSVLLWAVLLWWRLQTLIDYLQALFVEHDWFRSSSAWLGSIGLDMLKTLIVPLISMFLFLPLMILTALVFIGLAALPAVVRHVGGRHFSQLEKKHGGSVLGSLGTALGAFLVFVLAWCVTLPFYLFPPLALITQIVLWGWLTYRVVVYDVLAAHASVDERRAILRQHRWPLLLIGMVSGAAGAVPGVLWLGGSALSVVFFPFLAAASIWLYVLIFIFTGLWFAYYCFDALRKLRHAEAAALAVLDEPVPSI